MSTSARANPATHFQHRTPLLTLASSRKLPIFVAFSESGSEETLLLNVGENGLLVSSPADLACNFVARLCIRLHGLPKPVQVTARVVWSSETNKLAGVQLLNLNEYDRQQIRMWGARESAQSLQSEPDQPALVVPPSASSSEANYVAAGPKDDALLSTSGEIVEHALPMIVNKRVNSTVAGRAMLIATVCLAATILIIKAAPGNPFARHKNTRSVPSAAAPLAQETQPTPQPLDISNRAATQAAPPASPDDTATSKRAPIAAASPHHDSAKIVGASSAAALEENPAATQSDLSLTAALPAQPRSSLSATAFPLNRPLSPKFHVKLCWKKRLYLLLIGHLRCSLFQFQRAPPIFPPAHPQRFSQTRPQARLQRRPQTLSLRPRARPLLLSPHSPSSIWTLHETKSSKSASPTRVSLPIFLCRANAFSKRLPSRCTSSVPF